MRIRGRKFGQVAVYGAAAGGAFVGPVDAVSGAAHWYGLRANKVSYATGSNPAVDLLDQAGANPITINIKSDGTLDVAAIATWVAAHTVTTIKVTKVYDQIGTSHVTQATLASMPNLVLGPVTGLSSNRPAMVFSGAQVLSNTVSVAVSQPVSFSSVAFRNGSAVGGIIADTVANNAEMVFNSAANQAIIFAGGSPVVANANDNAWHSISAAFNGASSIIGADGVAPTSGSPGANGTSNNINIGESSFSEFLTGNINEVGIWPSAISSANMSSLSSNQHSYWGF